MRRGLYSLLVLSLFSLIFSTHAFGQSQEDQIFKTYAQPGQIKIMAYNVQNLFDNRHDAGKNDYEFLPFNHPEKKNCKKGKWHKACKQLSWTAEKIGWKIRTIAAALQLQGSLPDILVLSEVENPNVVAATARALGYNGFQMTNSPDARGIDLAVLYKTKYLKLVGFEEIPVQGMPYPTRNASAVHFELLNGKAKKDIIGIYPAHWPSQGTKASFVRYRAAEAMRALIDKYSASFRRYNKHNYYAVALGDFNSIASENPHPVDSILAAPNWRYRMYDAEKLAVLNKNPFMKFMPRGTYFYNARKAWNKLDRILVSRSLADKQGVDIVPNSFRIHAHASLSAKNDAGERIPFRYNHRANNPQWLGFSDHYAVHLMLNIN